MKPEHTILQYAKKVVARRAMRAAIAPLVRWSPMENPEAGYTAIVGCNRNLGGLLLANLRTLGRQRRTNLREVILAIDGSESEVGFNVVQRAAEVAPGLPVRVLHYNAKQVETSRRIDWGWVYAWLSWCIGIGAVRTRHAILHDFDALLLNPDVLESRYAQVLARKVEYLGIAYHSGGGTRPEDRLVRTFELMFDAAHVRATHEPIELFNTMCWMGGRRVEFDTFLNAQHKSGKTDILPIPEEEMVHPSQMICQYVDFCQGRGRVPDNHNLLMIPYYNLLGGDGSLLADITAQLQQSRDGSVTLWGKTLSVATLSDAHRAWVRKQASRMEAALYGSMRPEVDAFFSAIDRAGRPAQ